MHDRDADVDVVPGPDTMRHVRARQRAEYGGFNWGAAFFGWLVAVGMAALLVGLLAGAGAAVGLTETTTNADITQNAEEVTLGGGIALLVALLIAYFSGGYVAGRMSRFDGARQGIGVWIFGLLVTVALAVLAVAAGSEYNVLERLDLPRIPIDEGTLTTGGIIALVAMRHRHAAGGRRSAARPASATTAASTGWASTHSPRNALTPEPSGLKLDGNGYVTQESRGSPTRRSALTLQHHRRGRIRSQQPDRCTDPSE